MKTYWVVVQKRAVREAVVQVDAEALEGAEAAALGMALHIKGFGEEIRYEYQAVRVSDLPVVGRAAVKGRDETGDGDLVEAAEAAVATAFGNTSGLDKDDQISAMKLAATALDEAIKSFKAKRGGP